MQFSWELVGMMAVSVLAWMVGAMFINWAGEKFLGSTALGAVLFIWTAITSGVGTYYITTGPLGYVLGS